MNLKELGRTVTKSSFVAVSHSIKAKKGLLNMLGQKCILKVWLKQTKITLASTAVILILEVQQAMFFL